MMKFTMENVGRKGGEKERGPPQIVAGNGL